MPGRTGERAHQQRQDVLRHERGAVRAAAQARAAAPDAAVVQHQRAHRRPPLLARAQQVVQLRAPAAQRARKACATTALLRNPHLPVQLSVRILLSKRPYKLEC